MAQFQKNNLQKRGGLWGEGQRVPGVFFATVFVLAVFLGAILAHRGVFFLGGSLLNKKASTLITKSSSLVQEIYDFEVVTLERKEPYRVQLRVGLVREGDRDILRLLSPALKRGIKEHLQGVSLADLKSHQVEKEDDLGLKFAVEKIIFPIKINQLSLDVLP